MQRMRSLVAGLVGVSVVTTAAVGQGQNLLQNGGLEGPAGSCAHLFVDPGSSQIPGWVVSGAWNVDWFRNSDSACHCAYEGSYSVDLNGSPNWVSGSAIQQNIATVPGRLYLLKLRAAPSDYNTPMGAIKTLRLTTGETVTDVPLTTVPFECPGSWLPIEVPFVATGLQSVIELRSTFPDNAGGIMVDDVSVTEAPCPDNCESTIFVPTQFPTIQAAIDSVPQGVAKVISVLPGTYNQSFALNGKNIVVRGAPNDATIIDGTGLATSVVRFTGGEPATAGVENLVIRNGTVGSLIVPSATFRVGGGLYAANSSAFVKDCRFESNRADFGGGAYLFRSSTSVQGCVFLSNTAFSEGGALQLYESSGPIVGSSFTANAAGPAGAGAASALKVVGAQTAGATVLVSDCTIQDGVGGTDTSAVEMFENAGSGATRGVLRISNTVIEGNAASTGAGGLRVIGSQDSCVLADGTSICANTPRNVLGPFLIEGKATVCDCLADLTLDGAVNGADLGVVLAAWGAAASNGAGDANHDGIVDGADLASVLASWGACP